MSKTITVCSRLPYGIILDHPMKPAVKVTVAGLNGRKIIGAPYATTEVDADFWAEWIAVNAKYGPVMNGAIFAAKNEKDVGVVAREFENVKTGLEPMRPSAHGVKPVTKGDD